MLLELCANLIMLLKLWFYKKSNKFEVKCDTKTSLQEICMKSIYIVIVTFKLLFIDLKYVSYPKNINCIYFLYSYHLAFIQVLKMSTTQQEICLFIFLSDFVWLLKYIARLTIGTYSRKSLFHSCLHETCICPSSP